MELKKIKENGCKKNMALNFGMVNPITKIYSIHSKRQVILVCSKSNFFKFNQSHRKNYQYL
jgi:hypothetical protein